MTSLIILLWACGWVVGLWKIATSQHKLTLLDVILNALLVPASLMFVIAAVLYEKNHVIWRRK